MTSLVAARAGTTSIGMRYALRHLNTLEHNNISLEFELSTGRYAYECADVSACDGNRNVVVVAKLKHEQKPVMTSAENDIRKIWAMQNSLGIRKGSIFHIIPAIHRRELETAAAGARRRTKEHCPFQHCYRPTIKHKNPPAPNSFPEGI
jgi:hypothetical protein